MGNTPTSRKAGPAGRPALSGVFPIVATPFRADGSPDRDDLARIVDFIVASGADGLVFPGVASEFETLAADERGRLVQCVADATGGRIPLVVGVSAATADDASRHAAQARELQAVAVMAVAPPSMRDDPALQVDYYRRIAAHGVPIILQNAPAPAGCGFAAERIAQIVSDVSGIDYVKEETLPCGQRITRLRELLPQLPGVFGGAGGRYITDELARGACGTMPACELTDWHARQFAAHRAGDVAEVRRLYAQMLPLLNFQAVFRMAMTKEVLRRRGVIRSTHVRAAGPRLDAGDLRELDWMLADLKLPAAAA
jgi:4-hydroxy-tetrahydrodipicolinate synthase